MVLAACGAVGWRTTRPRHLARAGGAIQIASIFQERVRAGLARARSEGKRLGRPPIASALEKRFVRLWRLQGGPAYGSLPSGSASIHRQCSASAALSTAQASPWHSRLGARNERYSPGGLFMTPNRYLPSEVPEGPAAATSIQNNSGPPQGPADLPPAGS